jgi:cellulose synthase (UDP-forming)
MNLGTRFRYRFLRWLIPPPPRHARFLEHDDRAHLIEARALALLTTIVGAGYIAWLSVTVDYRHPVMAIAFLLAEAISLLLFIAASFTVWTLRFKPRQGLPIREHERVDIFVPTCGEPLPVLRATLAAVARIEWRGALRVYVLDDRASEDVRRLTESLGFEYRTRVGTDAPQGHAKAGNLNFGLSQGDSPFVLVLDADQIPQPYIVRALAGYLRFPDVAFVQSRQSFFVPKGDPFFNLDAVFYQAVQLGYDNRSAALSCGSGVLYRREALQQIGGFTTWNVVEDLTTSYALHARGWRSLYYPHALSTGLAPADIWGVCRQRSQWALDTMRLFFWDCPLFKRHLRWRIKMMYLVLPLAYLCAGTVFPFFFIIPLWTYLTGYSVIDDSEIVFALLRGTYFLYMALALRALFRRHEAGRQFQMLVGLFPVYVISTLRALFYPRSRRAPYAPNNADRTAPRPAFLAVLPQLAIVVLNAVLPFYAVAARTAAPRLILGNALVSAVAMWSLLPAISAALTSPAWDEQSSPASAYAQPAHSDL